MATQTHKDHARKRPAKSRSKKQGRVEPVRDEEIIGEEIVDEEIIDVHIGADEEKANIEKRRKEHQPPAEPGIPSGIGAPDNPGGPVEVTHHGDSGSIERDLGEADTARHDIESDAESGGGRNKQDVDATNNLRRPRP